MIPRDDPLAGAAPGGAAAGSEPIPLPTDGQRHARRLGPLAADALAAAVAVAVEIALLALGPPELRAAGVVTTAGWSVLCALPLAARRRAPWLAVALTVATLALPLLADRQPLTMVLSFMLVTYSTAARFPLRRAALAAGVLWLSLLVIAAVLVGPDEPEITPVYAVFANTLLGLVCFFVGRTVHARRGSLQALAERARVAEENQRALAEQAVADERRRIARELHDVVAHHVSVMGVLATGARRVLHRTPEAADEALRTIEETSRTTLREMRRLLDVLRSDTDPDAELAPQPDLAGIGQLVEQLRDAGLPVTLRVEGEPVRLDPGVALAVYRIVQEALTNTLKHAGAATAQVRLEFGDRWLVLEVTDTGRGPALGARRIGHGLVGMRERVALYGGTLRTGPRPGGGFRVYAKIPIEQLGATETGGAA